MRAVVTGGAGFIGHHLVAGLLERGHHVSVLDDFSSGSWDRLAPFGSRVEVREGSILDPAALDAAFAGCEVILHHAAIASVAQSLNRPRLVNDVNVGGTIEVMLAAARNGVRRVVFAGSSAVYGVPEDLPCTESHCPEPLSPYGVSKLAAEQLVHGLGRLHGIRTTVLRYFNVYGPGQDPAAEYAAVVPRFIATVLVGDRPTVNGSLDITRDFVYIADVVQANLLAAAEASPSGLTCNVASGVQTSLGQLIDAIRRATGRQFEPVIGPERPGDIPRSYADIALAQRQLNYAPSVDLGEGIERTLQAFRST